MLDNVAVAPPRILSSVRAPAPAALVMLLKIFGVQQLAQLSEGSLVASHSLLTKQWLDERTNGQLQHDPASHEKNSNYRGGTVFLDSSHASPSRKDFFGAENQADSSGKEEAAGTEKSAQKVSAEALSDAAPSDVVEDEKANPDEDDGKQEPDQAGTATDTAPYEVEESEGIVSSEQATPPDAEEDASSGGEFAASAGDDGEPAFSTPEDESSKTESETYNTGYNETITEQNIEDAAATASAESSNSEGEVEKEASETEASADEPTPVSADSSDDGSSPGGPSNPSSASATDHGDGLSSSYSSSSKSEQSLQSYSSQSGGSPYILDEIAATTNSAIVSHVTEHLLRDGQFQSKLSQAILQQDSFRGQFVGCLQKRVVDALESDPEFVRDTQDLLIPQLLDYLLAQNYRHWRGEIMETLINSSKFQTSVYAHLVDVTAQEATHNSPPPSFQNPDSGANYDSVDNYKGLQTVDSSSQGTDVYYKDTESSSPLNAVPTQETSQGPVVSVTKSSSSSASVFLQLRLEEEEGASGRNSQTASMQEVIEMNEGERRRNKEGSDAADSAFGEGRQDLSSLVLKPHETGEDASRTSRKQATSLRNAYQNYKAKTSASTGLPMSAPSKNKKEHSSGGRTSASPKKLPGGHQPHGGVKAKIEGTDEPMQRQRSQQHDIELRGHSEKQKQGEIDSLRQRLHDIERLREEIQLEHTKTKELKRSDMIASSTAAKGTSRANVRGGEQLIRTTRAADAVVAQKLNAVSGKASEQIAEAENDSQGHDEASRNSSDAAASGDIMSPEIDETAKGAVDHGELPANFEEEFASAFSQAESEGPASSATPEQTHSAVSMSATGRGMSGMTKHDFGDIAAKAVKTTGAGSNTGTSSSLFADGYHSGSQIGGSSAIGENYYDQFHHAVVPAPTHRPSPLDSGYRGSGAAYHASGASYGGTSLASDTYAPAHQQRGGNTRNLPGLVGDQRPKSSAQVGGHGHEYDSRPMSSSDYYAPAPARLPRVDMTIDLAGIFRRSIEENLVRDDRLVALVEGSRAAMDELGASLVKDHRTRDAIVSEMDGKRDLWNHILQEHSTGLSAKETLIELLGRQLVADPNFIGDLAENLIRAEDKVSHKYWMSPSLMQLDTGSQKDALLRALRRLEARILLGDKKEAVAFQGGLTAAHEQASSSLRLLTADPPTRVTNFEKPNNQWQGQRLQRESKIIEDGAKMKQRQDGSEEFSPARRGGGASVAEIPSVSSSQDQQRQRQARSSRPSSLNLAATELRRKEELPFIFSDLVGGGSTPDPEADEKTRSSTSLRNANKPEQDVAHTPQEQLTGALPTASTTALLHKVNADIRQHRGQAFNSSTAFNADDYYEPSAKELSGATAPLFSDRIARSLEEDPKLLQAITARHYKMKEVACTLARHIAKIKVAPSYVKTLSAAFVASSKLLTAEAAARILENFSTRDVGAMLENPQKCVPSARDSCLGGRLQTLVATVIAYSEMDPQVRQHQPRLRSSVPPPRPHHRPLSNPDFDYLAIEGTGRQGRQGGMYPSTSKTTSSSAGSYGSALGLPMAEHAGNDGPAPSLPQVGLVDTMSHNFYDNKPRALPSTPVLDGAPRTSSTNGAGTQASPAPSKSSKISERGDFGLLRPAVDNTANSSKGTPSPVVFSSAAPLVAASSNLPASGRSTSSSVGTSRASSVTSENDVTGKLKITHLTRDHVRPVPGTTTGRTGGRAEKEDDVEVLNRLNQNAEAKRQLEEGRSAGGDKGGVVRAAEKGRETTTGREPPKKTVQFDLVRSSSPTPTAASR
ncbi:unnamed protein product [Amoebophrya sp. A120]|nr:unnamed protein product [Amoebophrya sp. A120]|eukprot:GSA120T00005140001.1